MLIFGMILTLAALAVMPLSALASEETEMPAVVVPKDLNTGLYRDIYAFVTDKVPVGGSTKEEKTCYFFMPYSADLTKITYNAGGESKTLDLSEGKTATITLNGAEYKACAYKSVLPTVYLEINEEYGTIDAMHKSADHSAKCYGDMRIEVPDDIAAENGWEKDYVSVENKEKTPGTIELRGRGNSSWLWSEGLARPYQVKLEKKMDIMGMGAAKSYTLLKADQLQTTAKIFLNMGTDMGVAFTPSAEFVTVYLNGEYRGMYTLSEKIEINESRVNISNLEDEIDALIETTEGAKTGADVDLSGVDITGGYLVEVDNTFEDLQFIAQKTRLTIKEPENLDDHVGADSNYAYITELMTDLFNAVYGDGYLKDDDYAGHPGYAGKHFTEVMDMDSVTRYFLEQELSSNEDNGLGSMFFYKDKDSIDGKIYMSPVWDNDRCGAITDGWVIPNKRGYEDKDDGSGEKQETFLMAMCRHKEFLSYVIAYYENNVNYNNIKQTFEDYANGAKNAELLQMSEYIKNDADMTYYRWNYDWAFTPSKVPDYLKKRKAWIDANINTIKDFGTKGEFIEVENTIPKPDGKIVLNTGTADGKINISVNNDLGITQEMDVYTAVYDSSGILNKVFIDKNATVKDGETYTKSYDYANEAGQVKTMLWKADKIQPIDRVVNAN